MFSSSTVISLNLQKEKNVTMEAAHSMIEQNEWSLSTPNLGSLLRIAGAIGRRGQGAFPTFPLSTFTLSRLAVNEHLVYTWVLESMRNLQLANTREVSADGCVGQALSGYKVAQNIFSRRYRR